MTADERQITLRRYEVALRRIAAGVEEGQSMSGTDCKEIALKALRGEGKKKASKK